MTLKTISEKAKTFTFTHSFADHQTAQTAGHALMGYMLGTYHQPVIELTYKGNGQLVADYAEDKSLSETFKRICDGFEKPETGDTIESRYKLKRVQQLKKSENFDSLLDKLAAYELELLDYADRLLSDDPTSMDYMTADGTLELVGTESVELLKSLDKEGEYSGLSVNKPDSKNQT